MIEEMDVDVLVAGGGLGGLMAAHSARRQGATVLLLGGSAGASRRISVLNAALGSAPEDSPAALFDDMFKAGGFINNSGLLAQLCARIGPEVEELGRLGVPYARNGSGYARRQAAGSSWTRGVYTLGMIGVDVSNQLHAVLADDAGVLHLNRAILTDVSTCDGRVIGGLAFDSATGSWIGVRAGAVILATGGAGELFQRTTNPRGSRGTGYALALEAGAELIDMEFISFEPFITWNPGAKGHDLPTTVLKQGARVVNGLGQEFFDSASAPSKDVICRAMVEEVRRGRGTPAGAVTYDLTDVEPAVLSQYPQIQQALKSLRGQSATPLKMDVMPAQHYIMGGAKTDRNGETSVGGLYAVGEVAGGAHGAHRLAGAGGMEAVALGSIAGERAAHTAREQKSHEAVARLRPRPSLIPRYLDSDAKAILRRIASAMERGCGIVRTAEDTAVARASMADTLSTVRGNPDMSYVARSAMIGMIIATMACQRLETRGDHYREDHPNRDDSHWLGNLVATADAPSSIQINYRPICTGSGRQLQREES